MASHLDDIDVTATTKWNFFVGFCLSPEPVRLSSTVVNNFIFLRI